VRERKNSLILERLEFKRESEGMDKPLKIILLCSFEISKRRRTMEGD